METERQSHCWWFDSYNTSKCSRWLESTLAELNDKTKTMLKLIEEDADSFAQRAEMYYKKRPELISLVEDFYRAHRSLAERYDQLKSDRAVRVRSPLRHSLSLPKEEYEYVFDSVNSVKSFDSFTETAYSSEDAAESEVDDPEQEDEDEDDEQSNQDDQEVLKPLAAGGATYDELMKLQEELDRLTEQNEIQKNTIKQKEEEKEGLVKLLSDNISELRKVREEMGSVREVNLLPVMRENCEISVPFNEVKSLKDEIENLQIEVMYQKEEVKKKGELVIEVSRKFEEARYELIKLEEEAKTKKRYLENALAVKEEETAEVFKELEEMKTELEKLGKEMGRREKHLKNACVGDDMEKEGAIRHKDALIRKLKSALAERDAEKNETIRQLKNALAEKDMEKKEVIRLLTDALAEKDEEKREAIRQLSVGMEILREESKFLKKSLVNSSSPKKSKGDFQMLKGINLGKLFNLSSTCQMSVVAL